MEAAIDPSESNPATLEPQTEVATPASVGAGVPDVTEHQPTDSTTADAPMPDVEVSADPTLTASNSVSIEDNTDPRSSLSAVNESPNSSSNSSLSDVPPTSAREESSEVNLDSEPSSSLDGVADETSKLENSPSTASESSISTEGESEASAPLALRSAPLDGATGVGKGLLKLRSSPVIPASDEQSVKNEVDPMNQILIPGKGVLAGGKSRAKREKKARNVKWATDENLMEIHFIDTRLNLVKSWDPDCGITLPFAPHTLQAIKSVIKGAVDETSIPSDSISTSNDEDGTNFDLPETGITAPDFEQCAALPMISSFEEARKREHDMEQERARQAREELKNRLNSIVAKVHWRCPRSIVLPAECRIEESVEGSFDVDDRYSLGCMVPTNSSNNHVDMNNLESPMSPPSEPWSWTDEGEGSDSQAQVFPLTDGSNAVDVEAETFGMQRTNHNGTWNAGASRSSEHGNTGGSAGSFVGVLNDNAQMNMLGRASGLRRNVNNERQSGQRNSTNVSGALRSGVDCGIGKRSGREKAKLILAPNVRQLLSALQSSGILNGAKMNEVLSRSGGHGQEDNARPMMMRQPDANEMGMGGMGGNNYTIGEDRTINDQMNLDNVNGGVAASIGRMMGGVSGPISGGGAAGIMGAPPFGPGMGQGGLLECMPFGMPPVPPNAMGLPPPPPGLMQMGMGLGMPPMVGMPMMPMVPGNPMAMNGPGGNGNAGGVVGGNGMVMGGLNLPNNMGGPAPGVNGSGNGGHGGGGVLSAAGGGGSGGNVLGRVGKSGRNGRHVETITRPKSKGPKQRKKCKYFGTKQGCRDGDACMFAHH